MYMTKKNWDVSTLTSQINSMARECSSPYNDGFTAFEIKKDLWELKYIIDNAIKNTPNFSGEEEWLTAQEQKRIIKHLKS
jgi:hypothetical protein